jgi:hypothetical protein
MSYGDRAAPKGYSVPRDVGASAGPAKCQRCNGPHWTFECKAAAPKYQATLSRTQMLKRGIKAKAVAAAAPQTEREEFAAELRERAALLEAELREEAGLPPAGVPERKRARQDSAERPPTPPQPQDDDVPPPPPAPESAPPNEEPAPAVVDGAKGGEEWFSDLSDDEGNS